MANNSTPKIARNVNMVYVTFVAQRTDRTSAKSVFRVPYGITGPSLVSEIRDKLFSDEEKTEISELKMRVRIFYMDPDGYELNIGENTEARQLLKNCLSSRFDNSQVLIPRGGEYDKASIRHCVIAEVSSVLEKKKKQKKLIEIDENKVCPSDRVAYLGANGKRMTRTQRRNGVNWMLRTTFNNLVGVFKAEALKTIYGGQWKFNIPKKGVKTARGNFECSKCKSTVRYHCGFSKLNTRHTQPMTDHRESC